MARPRIFISSTYYDLKHVRADIERSIRSLGYETIRHETGSIPYSKTENLESGAYREVELSDVIVFIMGGRYGTESEEEPGVSVSQAELKRALHRGIPVFIFVESAVYNEFATYRLNKATEDVQYSSVDNIAVFDFLEQLNSLPRNNPITQFTTTTDITEFLKEQFAGLFQRFLQDQQRKRELDVLDEMRSVADTLNEVVKFLTAQNESKEDAIRNILSVNHPAFRQLKLLTQTSYRVFFSTRTEMEAWLKASGWEPVAPAAHDQDSLEEWQRFPEYLKFTESFFDEDGSLISQTEETWDDSWIQVHRFAEPPDE